MVDVKSLDEILKPNNNDIETAHAFNNAINSIEREGRDTASLRYSEVDQLKALNEIEDRHSGVLNQIVRKFRPRKTVEEDRKDVDWALYAADRYREGLRHDVLTGLPTLPYFKEVLEKEILQTARDLNNLIVVSLDLNGFKFINSNYGKPVGDEAIKLFASSLEQVSRGGDIVCRRQAGGDEFYAMFPGVPKGEDPNKFVHDFIQRLFSKVCERLQTEQFDWKVTTPEGEPIWFDKDLPLYSSFGFALCTPNDVDIRDPEKALLMIEQADQMLDEQKTVTKAYRGN